MATIATRVIQAPLPMTHEQLVERAARWLRNTKRCGVVLTEFHSAATEIPDAIGWTTGGWWSFLVECKTSKGDFYADKKKPGRRGLRANRGMGRERYYLAERGILSADLVREHRPGWGLLEIVGRQTRVRLKAIPFDHNSRMREFPILYSYARRIHQHGLALEDAQEVVRRAARDGLPWS